jgi:hypothetical protein
MNKKISHLIVVVFASFSIFIFSCSSSQNKSPENRNANLSERKELLICPTARLLRESELKAIAEAYKVQLDELLTLNDDCRPAKDRTEVDLSDSACKQRREPVCTVVTNSNATEKGPPLKIPLK